MQQLGRAYSGMYAMFCILILLTTIVASYGCLAEILDHGLSEKEIGLFLITLYCMSILYIICNEAYHASRKMGPLVQERLLNTNFGKLDDDTQKEINMFLTAIDKNPPTMNLNGYTNVNRELITSVSIIIIEIFRTIIECIEIIFEGHGLDGNLFSNVNAVQNVPKQKSATSSSTEFNLSKHDPFQFNLIVS